MKSKNKCTYNFDRHFDFANAAWNVTLTADVMMTLSLCDRVTVHVYHATPSKLQPQPVHSLLNHCRSSPPAASNTYVQMYNVPIT